MRSLCVCRADDAGFVVSNELLLIVTIAVIGLIVGFVAFRDAVVQELGDIAAAIGILDQSYRYHGVSDTNGVLTRGGSFADATDAGDLGQSAINVTPGSINIAVSPVSEGR